MHSPRDEIVDVDHVQHDRIHAADCADCDARDGQVDRFRRVLHVAGELDDAQRKRLLEIAEKCPVHRTLANEIVIETRLACALRSLSP